MIRYNYWWLIPFLCFLAGYFGVAFFVQESPIPVPHFVGLPVQQALNLASTHQLYLQIIQEKYDAEVPDGTVIEQYPSSKQMMRPTQVIHITISKQKPLLCAPNFIAKNAKELIEIAHQADCSVAIHALESNYPMGYCFAQSPPAGQPLCDNIVHAYTSAGITTIRILPDCKGMQVSKVQTFAQQFAITSNIVHQKVDQKSCECTDCTVVEQRPLPGSIINLKKPLWLYLGVS